MRELRYDPLRDRWVIISPERAKRPSDYSVEEESNNKEIDNCPFCEGNEDKTPPEVFAIRSSHTKPDSPGWRVRVVPNKFPALRIEDKAIRYGVGVFDVASGAGAHEVIIETPQHEKTLGDLPVDWISDVLIAYRQRIRDLFGDPRFRYVLVFKNYRSRAGASISHTHSQLIATPMVPTVVKEELRACRELYRTKERCLICDIIKQESEYRERVIYENDNYMVWAPFASSFPFETWIMPKVHLHDFSELGDMGIRELALVLKVTLLSIKNLLHDPPYNFVLHIAPPPFKRPGQPQHWDSIEHDYHWHIEMIPRLTSIAGFEWGTGLFINPTPPEVASDYLRKEIESNLGALGMSPVSGTG